ncbi:unnamed protein product, partial [marine sediment metagenome]
DPAAVGYTELTTGLQGSLGAAPPGADSIGTTELKEPSVDSRNIFYNSIGTFNNIFGSLAEPTEVDYAAFAPDKGRLWCTDYSDYYIYEIGTTTGNLIGSIRGPGLAHRGITYVPATKHLWVADNTVAGRYIYELGTTTGAEIGSFA